MLYAFLLHAFQLYAYFYLLHFDTYRKLKIVNLFFFFLQETEECPEEQISFEMVTGYVYTAPADMLDSQVSNNFRFLLKKVADKFRKCSRVEFLALDEFFPSNLKVKY